MDASSVTKAKVLLVLSADVVDRARVVAGKAMTALKLPVSLQIVFRALIEEGLKRERDPDLLDNVERQARAVRDSRSLARRRARSDSRERSAGPPSARDRAQPKRR